MTTFASNLLGDEIAKLIVALSPAKVIASFEEIIDANISRRREIKVILSDGDYWETWINGTKAEVLSHYMGRQFEGWNGESEYMRAPVASVEFLA